ncbi:hypothetical protein DPMN_081168 [Dreissena polymorpha]|uniref:SH2 domain-containing protein n=1 Tax=Dreissena polymorpha TaxID=45954 RepID=A0A9D4BHH8_DREPO|nr:hypothetical protein DPMN_081168 [Dreissena polymorpha]
MIMLDYEDEPVDLGQYAWYWGETHQELVRRELSRAQDGSYLVHHTGDIEFHMLAVKVGDDIVWQPIYCRDGLVGFTEPLGFESFEDALEAYTESQTETHDTLRNPLPKPDFSKLRETHATMKPVQLLKRLRDTHGLLGQRIDELDNVEGCIERLEQEIEEKSKSTEAYGVLIKVVSKQLEKTNELTSSSSDRLDEINNNCTALTKRLEGLRQEQTAIERERTSLVTERNEQSKLSTRCLDGIRDLENELQKIKDDIIEFSLYENCMGTMMLFIDHLLASDVTEFAQKVEEYDIDKSMAKSILKTESDGTFIVRTNNDPNKPYSISVSYSDAENEGLVVHFPVKRDDGCLGFDEQTCIFHDIQDLVTCYARIPFGSHDSTYGDLTLVRQVEKKAIEEGKRERKSSVFSTFARKMSLK